MAEAEVHNISDLGGNILECVTDLRDVANHGNREQFRTIMGRVGFILAYELSKEMRYAKGDVETPLATATGYWLAEQPVVGTIFRAGLPLYNGVMQIFPEADNAFVGAYRNNAHGEDVTVRTDYIKSANLTDRVLIMADPMLATGTSLLDAVDALSREHGKPSEVHIIAAIAAVQGIKRVQEGLEEREFTEASI